MVPPTAVDRVSPDADGAAMQSLLHQVVFCRFDFQGADRQLAIEGLRPLLRDEHAAGAGYRL
jgi:hypothetical protein